MADFGNVDYFQFGLVRTPVELVVGTQAGDADGPPGVTFDPARGRPDQRGSGALQHGGLTGLICHVNESSMFVILRKDTFHMNRECH